MRELTEDEVLQAIQAANLGGNTIRLTFDSGPCEVTRTTRVADLLAQAIVRKFCEANRIALGVLASAPTLRHNQHLCADCTTENACRNRLDLPRPCWGASGVAPTRHQPSTPADADGEPSSRHTPGHGGSVQEFCRFPDCNCPMDLLRRLVEWNDRGDCRSIGEFVDEARVLLGSGPEITAP